MQEKPGKKPAIAAFDFDKTITEIDTLNDLIIYKFGYIKFISKMICLSPLLLLYVLNIIPNYVAKQKLFASFFAGLTEKQFNKICKDYSLNRIKNILKKEAIKKIRWHKKEGHKIIIISASMKNWIAPWAKENGIKEVISTEVEIKNSILTGKFRTRNCHGKEKVQRLLEKYPSREKYFLYAYGDSRGDKELLKLADKKFYRKFN